MSFLDCLCCVTDEAKEHIRMGLESQAGPSAAFPELAAGAGEQR